MTELGYLIDAFKTAALYTFYVRLQYELACVFYSCTTRP